jgi:hypothetical protein
MAILLRQGHGGQDFEWRFQNTLAAVAAMPASFVSFGLSCKIQSDYVMRVNDADAAFRTQGDDD